MCKLIFILILIIDCTICISNIRKPLGGVPLIKKNKSSNSIPTPTTYDRIPVFAVNVNDYLLVKPEKYKGYTYFMDSSDAIEFMADCYMIKAFDQKIFSNLFTISLKTWFEMIDPNVERIDSYVKPRLKPSCVQDQKYVYKLKGDKKQEPIPVYYSEGLKVSRKTLWNLFGKERKEQIVYFFNINDLKNEINNLDDKVEREIAKSRIKIISLLDLLKRDDVEKLLFVMNSNNLQTLSELNSTPTPWVL